MKKEHRERIWEKCNGKCAYCGDDLKFSNMQVDHIIPQRNFITHVTNKVLVPKFLSHLTIYNLDHIDNLLPACKICNNWKSTHSLEVFRNELKMQIERLNKYSSNYRIAKKYGLVKEIEKPIVFYFEKLNQ